MRFAAQAIPDLVMMDVRLPGMNGIEAGADDFLSKPINRPELFARVKSLLRVKALQDDVRRQALELERCNSELEARVKQQVSRIERLGRMKDFFPLRSPKRSSLRAERRSCSRIAGSSPCRLSICADSRPSPIPPSRKR